jgi:hypothetical protein
MNRRWWYLLALILLAACGPVQVGLEPGTAIPTVTAARTATPAATRASTERETERPTVAAATVTASAPAAATVTSSPSPRPPSATFAATRPPATRVLPTVAPSATPTRPAPAGMPVVETFTADRAEADAGEPVTLAWTTREALGARLHTGTLDASGSLVWSTLAADLPPSGSIVVAVDDVAPAQLFRLEALSPSAAPGPSLPLSIARRNCPEAYAFFFPAGRFNCAAGPSVLAPMAEQVFEHGRLLWLEANHWINPPGRPIIFVMNDSGGWLSRPDTWLAGEPDSDPSLVPPVGLYQPVGSLGKVWRDEWRDTLGWALAPEQRYTGAYQEGWAPQPGAESGAPGWYTRDLYLRLADNEVVRFVWSSRFTGQTWELLPR